MTRSLCAGDVPDPLCGKFLMKHSLSSCSRRDCARKDMFPTLRQQILISVSFASGIGPFCEVSYKGRGHKRHILQALGPWVPRGSSPKPKIISSHAAKGSTRKRASQSTRVISLSPCTFSSTLLTSRRLQISTHGPGFTQRYRGVLTFF